MRARRRRSLAVLVAVAVVAAVALALSSPSSRPARSTAGRAGSRAGAPPAAGRSAAAVVPARRRPGPPAVEAGLYTWQLLNPISREVVAPGPAAGQLVLAGGLASGGGSDSGVYTLSTSDGSLHLQATLPQATHDAAGGIASGALYVFGGGQAAPSGVTQRVIGSAAGVSGSLPQARADATSVTIGHTLYVVGGYDGPAMDPQVLATTDGRSFHPVATLPVAVRYAAVAALGGSLYVFGGQGASGAPVDSVQLVDLRTGTARLAGHLPSPLSAAAAADLGGTIYLAGGVTGASTPRPTRTVLAFDPARQRFLVAGALPVAVSNAGAAVTGGRLVIVGGETAGGNPTSDVQFVKPDRSFGVAGQPGAGSPYFGDKLLVADRGNQRLLVLDDTGKIIWKYPSPTMPAPPGGFYYPDDAFFLDHGRKIMVTQEGNYSLVELAYPSGKVLWQYGHPGVAGGAPGYLDNPDDAYVLRNGDVTIADAKNCRVLVVDMAKKTVVHQIGTTGACTHQPPNLLGSPNGDTPLPDGNILVSEINGSWIDEYTKTGKLLWTTELPMINYPSDPQPLGGGRYMVVDYENPGAILEFDRSGHVTYEYRPTTGPGVLDQPSLGELLPSGVFLLNDDYNDRLVAIDPATGAIVWQYGQTGVAGTAPGLLNTPDGFDVLAPNGSTPTHPWNA